mmetsp:Transcript_21018/g.49821  ORF Transcript_21018/g.49821 Transcript_21018/m.49821 type:complete len:376 (-) Transcript_21018:102-1229(-)
MMISRCRNRRRRPGFRFGSFPGRRRNPRRVRDPPERATPADVPAFAGGDAWRVASGSPSRPSSGARFENGGGRTPGPPPECRNCRCCCYCCCSSSDRFVRLVVVIAAGEFVIEGSFVPVRSVGGIRHLDLGLVVALAGARSECPRTAIPHHDRQQQERRDTRNDSHVHGRHVGVLVVVVVQQERFILDVVKVEVLEALLLGARRFRRRGFFADGAAFIVVVTVAGGTGRADGARFFAADGIGPDVAGGDLLLVRVEGPGSGPVHEGDHHVQRDGGHVHRDHVPGIQDLQEGEVFVLLGVPRQLARGGGFPAVPGRLHVLVAVFPRQVLQGVLVPDVVADQVVNAVEEEQPNDLAVVVVLQQIDDVRDDPQAVLVG